ncbi:3-phenylpropionate/trans-cinnamate dioxygenase ferredoxin reductase subunit [Variovorax sp. PDC80]|uniref:NAD(P)/FAD-dependent oxidoreductase n=1 Tax=Variovorax sp. PDC80 TaxID=1882827 RepID=UPI0008F28790|nr:FAD-dependent oxidoreductase [Variovorax sp. PDC80]SFO97866.1 3-phenylpropionate/trans-cinnamate dioxygenase ferredoxin reductase subunit [Variovorax sp. PDC80]
MQQVVIVGAGHAGFQCCASLRQEGFEGAIVLVGDEASLPYQRPPLSKAYLLAKASASDLHFRPERFFEEQRVQRVQGRVELIDRAAQRVVLTSGQAIAYDHLVIATGSSPRRMRVEGAELEGVMSLQTLVDADRLRERLADSRRAVVIGAGFIGLEFASVARALGLDVTVLDVADRALARAASPHSAQAVAASHEGRGTRLRFGCGVTALEGHAGREGGIAAVRTADGETLPADLVVVGIGAEPRTQLAAQAGLAVDNGIRVDAQLLSSDPAISAIGDVAAFPDPVSGRPIRLESVQNAGDQARSVAARLAGKTVAHGPVPWFWSDQGELRLQIAGLRAADDTHVVLRDAASSAATVLCIREGRLAAVETLNRAGDHMLARRLLAKGVALSEEEALAPGFQLKALA